MLAYEVCDVTVELAEDLPLHVSTNVVKDGHCAEDQVPVRRRQRSQFPSNVVAHDVGRRTRCAAFWLIFCTQQTEHHHRLSLQGEKNGLQLRFRRYRGGRTATTFIINLPDDPKGFP